MENEQEEKKMYFNPGVAKLVGVEEATLYNDIDYWCYINKNNQSKKHHHDDKWWVYYSARELSEKYGFWTESQIKRILKNLLGKGLIAKGRFNRKGYGN